MRAKDAAGGVRWWSASSVIALIVLYLALHFALRLAITPTLGFDDAEQALFAQHWAIGYRTLQPPLFTWLLLPLTETAGVGVLAVSILRYALLALTYVMLYLLARRSIRDPRLAALAVFSFALFYVFGYYAHHDLTHTTALGAAIACSFYVFARLVEEPSAALYALLGVCFGLGLLAKWNFIMLALGLPLACLLLPRYRALVLDPRTVLAIAAGLVVVGPTAAWMLAQGATPLMVSGRTLSAGPGAAQLAVLIEGTRALAGAAILFALPFLVIFLIIFGRAAYHGAVAPPPEGAPPPLTPEFFATLMVLVLGLHWLLVPALGATAFTARWMHPALMALPIFAFQLVERAGAPSPRQVQAYLLVLLACVALALGARIARQALGADWCGRCRELAPFGEIAGQVRRAGFQAGTIVAEGFHIGGNLRAAFPQSRVMEPDYPPAVWPTSAGDGQCLAVWAADEHAARRRARVRSYLSGQLGVPADAARKRGRAEALMPGSTTKRFALGYELFPDGAGDCR